MKVAGVREFRTRSASLMGRGEPVVVTRHGKVSGVYLPLRDPDRIPDDLRRELIEVIGEHLSRTLDRKGITEARLQKDFDDHRRRRR